MEKFRKIKKPRRRITFKTTCPGSLPKVSIVAVHENNLDTIYYASGTEETIAYKRRCLNCKDMSVVVGKFLGIKIHKRVLRRKYIFRKENMQIKIIRKVKIDN
jgi:hypothetical protein